MQMYINKMSNSNRSEQRHQFNYRSIVELDRLLTPALSPVVLTGESLSLRDILSIVNGSTVSLSENSRIKKRMEQSYSAMMRAIKAGRPVYGSNSSFGGQAGKVLNAGNENERVENARKLSNGLVFLDITVGPELSEDLVRAAMAIRTNMLLKGVSAVRYETLQHFIDFLNHKITPVVHAYGGVGASGDLAHNQRVASALRGLPSTRVSLADGTICTAQEALQRYRLSPLVLDPKEGLACLNGDNFSSAYASLVYCQLVQLFLLSVVVGAMTVEVLQGSNRSFHPLLSSVRPHPGQRESAALYRYLLDGSKLAYQELQGHVARPEGIRFQDGYSLRCLSQFEGVMIETLSAAYNTIGININSASDNPLWVPEEETVDGELPWQWVSGGNFLAMHMAETLDRMRKVITQLIKRNDRHLARLIDTTESNGLPANLSDPDHSITQCSFKGIQIQSGMFDVYSALLSFPVTTMFGTHEERNQDLTSHAMTSGLLAMEGIRVLSYSLAMNLLAVAQAIDLRGGPSLVSARTRPVYEWVRTLSPYVSAERPLHDDIENIFKAIRDGTMAKVIQKKVFNNFSL